MIMRRPSTVSQVHFLAALLLVSLFPCGLFGQGARADSLFTVARVAFGPARLGANPIALQVKNVADSVALAVLDVRAEPGMWLLPNMQKQFGAELGPGEERTIAGTFEFRRMSPEATLRVTIGPGERLGNDRFELRAVAFRQTYEVGRDSPDAYDPNEYFTITRREPFEIFAWKGSLAAREVESIASERLSAMQAIEALLAVKAPARIRLVFYADEATKIEQTGHQGLGWALGTTIVEVYNEQQQLDPYHELTHIVAAAAGVPPPVLDEGFAVYATERLGSDALRFLGSPGDRLDQVVCGLRGTERYIPLEELFALDNIGSRADRSGREYAEAGSFVKYLLEMEGVDRFRKAYSALSVDAETSRNLVRLGEIYGRALEQLETAWLVRVGDGCQQSR